MTQNQVISRKRDSVHLFDALSEEISTGHLVKATDLKRVLDDISEGDLQALSLLLADDSRKSVQSELAKKMRFFDKEKKRTQHLEWMLSYERDYKAKGYHSIAGIDEAGRGPLVGPVVAAVAVIDDSVDWRGIDDSKKLTEAQRDMFYDQIVEHAITYGVGVATHEEIDTINILNATKLAMKRAVNMAQKKKEIDFLLIDAVKLDDINIEQLSIIKGDQKSASIAAASILAKVTRDRMMQEIHAVHPEYGFDQNKGYGTQQHYDALNVHGITPYHRLSFLKKWQANL